MSELLSGKEYRKRVIDKQIEDYLDTCGAVCIEGPKWCGKTWTSAYHSESEFLVGDPAKNFQNRQFAMISPEEVLDGETPRLIDEWQEVPALWDAIRGVVDKRGKAGQFLITGSSTPKIKGVLHSGAGRIARVRMRTMSLFESGESSINNYESGSEELITLHNIINSTDGIYGGRFSGGGFKGCCIALVNPDYLEEIEKNNKSQNELQSSVILSLIVSKIHSVNFCLLPVYLLF